MKQIRHGLLIALLLGANTLVVADDTDIYMSPNASPGTPLVMISIDWRPNLGSTVCGGGECQSLIDDGFLVPANSNQITYFELLKATLKKVLEPVDGIAIGLMANHDQRSNCAGPTKNGCSNGGYMLSGFKDIGDPSERAQFYAALDAIPLPHGNASHKYQGKELFFEFFRYLTGQGVYNGHNGWTDYGTNKTRNLDDALDTAPNNAATLRWDPSIEDNGTYKSPLPDMGSCSKIYTINVLFQVSQHEDDSDGALSASKAGGGMGGISNNPTFENVLEYLHDTDLADGSFNSSLELPGRQNVTSYFISEKSNTKTNDYATAGGTGRALSLSEDPDEMYRTLRDLFLEILSVSTTFVSPSVPVNVFNRAKTLNDMYLSLFQANEDMQPRWTGSLKKLKIDKDSNGNLVLEDANGNPAVSTDGRLKHSALTYWTHAEDLPDPGDDDDFLAGKDGRTVDRGGAGGVIPGFRPLSGNTPGTLNPVGTASTTTTRKLFTEPDSYTNGTAADLRPFEATTATAQALLTNSDSADSLFQTVMDCSGCSYAGATAADKATAEAAVVNLIKFARGLDTQDEDGDGDTTDTRAWLFGDALHSRPVAINYGAIGAATQNNPDIRVVMGSNDGFMRMFDADDNSGVELWGFTPRALIPKMQRLKDNSIGTPVHAYLVDGAPTVLAVDNNGDGTLNYAAGDKVVAYIGLRRGGKRYYALDISNPDDPHLLWSITNSDTDFTQLGQTWSTPRVARMQVDTDDNPATTNDVSSYYVLLFAGGYNGDDAGDGLGDLGKDERDDDNPFVGSNDDEGNAIFIVNALTGELIWKAIKTATGESTGPVTSQPKLYKHSELHDSIAADLSIIDTSGNSHVDRMYVGDTGGVIWRGDFPGAVRSNWTLKPVLSVGRHFSNTNANDRRFFHRVDFVQSRDESGDFDAIVVGSGDRPHPLGETVKNYLYMFKDRNTLSGNPPSTAKDHDDLADLTDNCLQDGDSTDCTDANADTKIAVGWRIKLENCPDGSTGDCGEKNLAQALTIKGKVFLTTYVPPESVDTESCAPAEGGGLFYGISLSDASAVFNFDVSNDAGGSETLERFESMKASGIPAQLVPMSDGKVIRSDLQIEDTTARTSANTYWYKRYRQ